MIQNPTLRTPLIPYTRNNKNIFLKAENLQILGSYKIRGVYSALQLAAPHKIANGLSAASAGNMAQAVAYMARVLKISCEIYVPDTAPAIKKDAIRNLGAHLIELPFSELWELVRQPPLHQKGLFIHPVFTPGLLEGYGSIAQELIADRPTLNAVVIPFGVGGLTLGVARALQGLRPDIHIYAVEPETAAPLKAALKAKKPIVVERHPSIADALGTPEVLGRVFYEIQKVVADSIIVSTDEIKHAIRVLAIEQNLTCEGAAAAALAAGIKLSKRYPEMEIACLLTGGNISKENLQNSLAMKLDV